MTTDLNWIPPVALERLIEELARLSAQPNPDQQTVARVRELRSTLRRTEASKKPDDGVVESGMRVTALLTGETRSTVFVLADRELASWDPGIGTDVYSPSSPLGQAIIGSSVGDVVSYAAPTGRTMQVEILAAAPYA